MSLPRSVTRRLGARRTAEASSRRSSEAFLHLSLGGVGRRAAPAHERSPPRRYRRPTAWREGSHLRRVERTDWRASSRARTASRAVAPSAAHVLHLEPAKPASRIPLHNKACGTASDRMEPPAGRFIVPPLSHGASVGAGFLPWADVHPPVD